MKKLLKAVALAMMCFTFVLVMYPAQAKAVTGTRTLIADQPYLDSIDTYTGTNYYEFTMPQDGKVTFIMSVILNQDEDSNADFSISIKDSKNNELENESLFSMGYTSRAYNFKKGEKLSVQVKNILWAKNVKYTLTAKMESLTDWELEDAKGTPTILANKKLVNGILHWNKDIDLFQYIIPNNGPTTFTFDVPDRSVNPDSWGWNILFLDNKKGEIYKETGVKGELVSRTFNFKKGTVLYVKIESTYSSDSFSAAGIPYTLTAKTIAGKDWEIEKNDSFATATRVASKKVKASLYQDEDMDYFVYKAVGAKTQIKLTSGVTADTVSNEWRVRVFNKNKKLIKDYTTKAGGAKTIKTKKGQKYYIVVSSSAIYYSDNPTVGQIYALACKKK